jgi:hypothetical protein
MRSKKIPAQASVCRRSLATAFYRVECVYIAWTQQKNLSLLLLSPRPATRLSQKGWPRTLLLYRWEEEEGDFQNKVGGGGGISLNVM